METQEIYAVECSAGMYDDFSWWIDSIFITQGAAQNRADELNEQTEKLKSAPSPIDKPYTDMSEEEIKVAVEHRIKVNDAKETRMAEVKKYTLTHK